MHSAGGNDDSNEKNILSKIILLQLMIQLDAGQKNLNPKEINCLGQVLGDSDFAWTYAFTEPNQHSALYWEWITCLNNHLDKDAITLTGIFGQSRVTLHAERKISELLAPYERLEENKRAEEKNETMLEGIVFRRQLRLGWFTLGLLAMASLMQGAMAMPVNSQCNSNELFQMYDHLQTCGPDAEFPWANDGFKPAFQMHSQGIASLDELTCKPKMKGVSEGMICSTTNDITWYLKKVDPGNIRYADPESKSDIRIYEEYNREFFRNIGIRVPETLFFGKKKRGHSHYSPYDTDSYVLYIGSLKINDLKDPNYLDKQQLNDMGFFDIFKYTFSRNNLNLHEALGPDGLARLLVASTFVADLHSSNWGYDRKGFIAIDVDGYITITTLENQIEISLKNIKKINNNFEDIGLTMEDIIKMKEIYEEMLHIPLPPHHDQFSMSEEDYHKILLRNIRVCDRVIENGETGHLLTSLLDSFQKAQTEDDEDIEPRPKV